MCVIMIRNGTKSNKADIKKMWDKNSDGAGVAWNDGKKTHYIKGIMNVERLIGILNNRNITKNDYVVHFRMASIGSKGQALTHPFLIDCKGSNPITYSGDKDLLIHNGHDAQILNRMIEAHTHNMVKIPSGEFSDTRATAVMSAHCGHELCGHISGKFVVITPKEIITYGVFEEKDGAKYSNTSWQAFYGYVSGKPLTSSFGCDGTFSTPKDLLIGDGTDDEYAGAEWYTDKDGIIVNRLNGEC